MKTRAFLLVVLLSLLALPCLADNRFLVRASSNTIGAIAADHGLTILGPVDDQRQLFLVSSSSAKTADEMETVLDADARVLACETDALVGVSESRAALSQSTAAILDSLSAPVATTYFGATVLQSYVQQPATALIRLDDTQNELHITGNGIVAVIDTGVDPNHPVLQPVLLPGYDFVHGWSGTASEWVDLPAGAAVLNQSTAAILDGVQTVLVNQSTAAILDASQLPPAFGHGTMVAGLVHLVAPTAQIMPLKAFGGDGTGELANILRAIYYAVDNHATVINMSFSLPSSSPELVKAINYAIARGVIPVASVGNTGQQTVSYPAALSGVIGVGSTSNLDVRSVFSSYGAMVFVGAPGEGVITTYPGNRFAAAWGTSFSAPMVAGAAALARQAEPAIQLSETADAIGHGKSVAQMGKGRIDLYSIVQHAF